MSKAINEKECPKCHCIDTKVTDTTYNQESRKCKQCGTEYHVNFKLVPSSIRIVNNYQL